jgi:hypothetical protein
MKGWWSRPSLREQFDPDGALYEYSQREGLEKFYETMVQALDRQSRQQRQSRKDLGLLLPTLVLIAASTWLIRDTVGSIAVTFLLWAGHEALRHSPWWRIKE